MTKYAVTAIIGTLVSLVPGIFVTPVLSVIIGSFMAGRLCKEGAGGGAGVGIVRGMLYTVPMYLFAGIVASVVPVLGVVLGRICIWIMIVVSGPSLLGGILGFVGGMRE